MNNRVRGNVSGWKATSFPGRLSLWTRLGGKLTCTITCVALFEAVGVCDGPKSLSTSIKGETVVRKTFLRNFAIWKSCLGKFLICCAGVKRSMKTHQQAEDLRQTIDIFCTGFRTSLVAGGG